MITVSDSRFLVTAPASLIQRNLPLSTIAAPSSAFKPIVSHATEQATLNPATCHQSVHNPIKRFVDIVGALIGLAFTAIIFIPIAISIQLDNPGPVLYSQLRCGVKGRPFRIWKFRSMVTNADKLKHLVNNQAKGSIFKNKHDPRVTAVGRFLRRTSLDEFPQFWNVLMGDMSLVGTRPPTVDEVIRYKRHHWKRLDVKPGITGEWQVNGRSSVSDFEKIVELDMDYQAKWSIQHDINLIIRTFLVVLDRRGAY